MNLSSKQKRQTKTIDNTDKYILYDVQSSYVIQKQEQTEEGEGNLKSTFMNMGKTGYSL